MEFAAQRVDAWIAYLKGMTQTWLFVQQQSVALIGKIGRVATLTHAVES